MIYDSILIANRGEIACRIIETAHEMGIRCIAIYVDADKNEPFVHMSDQSIRLPDGGYLDSKEIIKAAKESGAQAIHPGYGFLSENASFARKVIKEGLIWVGPSPHVISVMGDKLKAKELAEKAGVPTLPMTSNIKNAKKIGFPLLIKAAAGGGGKGMRIVHKEKDLKESIKSAQREAQSGFGDDRVFIERYVQKSRHIEIQILGDAHGNVVHLGERECSIQRRHQKIIEESPSSRISEDVRAAMGNAAIKLAKKIKYKSAGTVEFLFDDKTEEFWFLEINTRLQVEHPVTEEVTGIDLVSEQLRIARDEELGYTQDDITFMGHSIEARLYAENPDNDFLPETGQIIAFESDPENEARWDSGISIGSNIGTNFDPMLAKIISYADTRNDAILKLIRTLESAHIGGVITNREFLIECLKAREFYDGNTTTDFINQVQPNKKRKLTPTEIEHAASIAALWIQRNNRIKTGIAGFMPTGWTNGRLPKQKIDFVVNDNEHSVSYRYEKNKGFVFDCGKTGIIHSEDDFGLDVEFNGKRHYSRITLKNENILVHMPFGDVMLKIKPRFVLPGVEIQAGSLTAPMPGKVITLNVKKGSRVKTGDVLVILEAMKMEHSIKASHNGIVSKVLITKDDQVENGAPLMIVDSK
jgi:propionyl-CoA carboxylase alpha chain